MTTDQEVAQLNLVVKAINFALPALATDLTTVLSNMYQELTTFREQTAKKAKVVTKAEKVDTTK